MKLIFIKNLLASIFNAFAGADFGKKEFRKDFFSSIDDDTLKKISLLFYKDKKSISIIENH